MSSVLFLVEIRSWDWPLHVGVRPGSAIAQASDAEAILCSQAIAINGQVITPEAHRSKLIYLSLHPHPWEIITGGSQEQGVGSLHRDPVVRKDLGFSANLLLPADTLQNTLFCLQSVWRRIHLWVDDHAEPAIVTDFAFSADVDAQGQLDVLR
jgi:hypothetical protein